MIRQALNAALGLGSIWPPGCNPSIGLHKIYHLGQASKALSPAIGKGMGAQLVYDGLARSLIVDPMFLLGILGARVASCTMTMGIGRQLD